MLANRLSRPTFWKALPCLILLVVFSGCGKAEPADLLARANDALDFGRYDEACQLVEGVPESDPGWNECQYILGRAAMGQGDARGALERWKSVARDDSVLGQKTCRARAELFLIHCEFVAAIEELEYLASKNPFDLELNGRLAGLLNGCALRSRAEPYLLVMLNSTRISLADLVSLLDPLRPYGGTGPFNKCSTSFSSDPYVQMFQVTGDLRSSRVASAMSRLKRVVSVCPEWADAQAILGEICLETNPDELEEWSVQLPASIRNHSGVLYVKGLWARQLEKPQVAARCFWQAVRQAPFDRRAMFQLGQVLRGLSDENAEIFEQRAEALKRISLQMELVLTSEGRNSESFEDLILHLREIGRDLEAMAWTHMALDRFGPQPWIDKVKKGLNVSSISSSIRQRPECDVAALCDFSSWPEFEVLEKGWAGGSVDSISSSDSNGSGIRFNGAADTAGIHFTYFQSPDAFSRDVRIFESTGGGIAVIDFDCDLAPDVYFTQGEYWPKSQNAPDPSANYSDVLYRNRGSEHGFAVADSGIASDDGYGQSCTAGDYNSDGFPDLYVANIGGNSLLLNNGDGTFSDVSDESGIDSGEWTTSCLILDLNNDGNPDIYDVNYLSGESIFQVECGKNRCSVRDFEGAEDHVWISQGDGSFVRIPNATPKQLAKGLGIVAMFSKQDARPSLFIANDQVPNFLLAPVIEDGVYQDVAVASGLAVNMLGDPTAALGVAAGDINGDRLMDLFVTNFESEANCLYLQQEGGFFQDAVISTGLRVAGMQYVGWGTQFLDAANRGTLDIVVSNGHVADFGDQNGQYRMPLQFFEGTSDVRFSQRDSSDVGELFEILALGRSVATLDWDLDGRIDFLVSNIASPVTVAHNDTRNSGNWLQVQLHGRDSARDACGADIEIVVGGKIIWRQLSAGDGYQVSNQRMLHFGLADAAQVDSITVHWPSGKRTIVNAIPANTLIICTEGSPSATCLHKERLSSVAVTVKGKQ